MFDVFQSNVLKKEMISNPIELEYSRDIFEPVQSTHSTCFITGGNCHASQKPTKTNVGDF